MIKLRWFYLFIIAFVLLSCEDREQEPLYRAPSFMEIPKGFDAIITPKNNQFTQARWELGKKLFYDPIMSIDSSISCASCHKSDLAFSDDVAVSLGVEDRLGMRNAPTLTNLAYHPYFTREGAVPTLEMQILVPIQEHNEFDFNIVLLAERLAQDSGYVHMAADAYDREPDPFVITRSLACFERSLISGYSRFDHFEYYGDEAALSDSEKRGMTIFFGDKANCSSCHEGFNFTNYNFENNGLYLEYPDKGRFRLTSNEEDLGRFKIPSLRNIELSAPYMHDGSLSRLDEVIEHYNLGGYDHPNKSKYIKPLGLSESEKKDLLAFLHSLTDESFVRNPQFKK